MAGFAAFGVQFQRGNQDGPPETFGVIGEATNISGPSMSRETIDVTSHDSPEKFMEFVGSLIDPGEVTFTVNWDPAIHIPLKDDLKDPLPRNYRIVLPTPPGGEWRFPAIATGMEHEYPHDDKMSADFTFKISGEPIFVEP